MKRGDFDIYQLIGIDGFTKCREWLQVLINRMKTHTNSAAALYARALTVVSRP